MLSSSIILFLRDALPVFVLLAFIVAMLQHQQERQVRRWFSAAVIALLLLYLFIQASSRVAQWFHGQGLEVLLLALRACQFGLLYLMLIGWWFRRARLWQYAAFVLAVITAVMELHDSALYFVAYWQQAPVVVLLGTILGITVCLAVATLVHLMMTLLLQQPDRALVWIPVMLYGTGRLTDALPLLMQADLLPASPPLWQFQSLLADETELGYLLNVLVGYQSSPLAIQVLVYIVALALGLSGLFILKRRGQP
ncbi:hypothetical protein HMF8227_02886 [Saliniradius amylolyticus]|uniref:Uncharacterized protein n=1 Tax=Saliniradius amylolyticus TaxID=2183582 RepID=A0A2S2E6Q3_9ALTE|nr:hypothetical protein [Saliniradius amylolyticus]AWL13334.1 hypothetical protein HMF8227_02886 [Saliniradius amylolyticus]